VDGLEAADRGAVEHLAVGEEVDRQRLGRHVEVLHDPGQVTEPDVDELDVLGLDEVEDFLGGAEHDEPLVKGGLERQPWGVVNTTGGRHPRRGPSAVHLGWMP
jgi:hypothetical protein